MSRGMFDPRGVVEGGFDAAWALVRTEYMEAFLNALNEGAYPSHSLHKVSHASPNVMSYHTYTYIYTRRCGAGFRRKLGLLGEWSTKGEHLKGGILDLMEKC